MLLLRAIISCPPADARRHCRLIHEAYTMDYDEYTASVQCNTRYAAARHFAAADITSSFSLDTPRHLRHYAPLHAIFATPFSSMLRYMLMPLLLRYAMPVCAIDKKAMHDASYARYYFADDRLCPPIFRHYFFFILLFTLRYTMLAFR